MKFKINLHSLGKLSMDSEKDIKLCWETYNFTDKILPSSLQVKECSACKD